MSNEEAKKISKTVKKAKRKLNDCFESMEATSDFGNISKAGLQFSRNDNKLGVYSLYEPDFTSAKKHVYDLMNELPENCDMINARNIRRKLEKYERPKIRLWDETDPVEMRLDCSFNKLREITKLCDVDGNLGGNIKVFAKEKNCPVCGEKKTFKYENELTRHVKAMHPELAKEFVPKSYKGNVDGWVNQKYSCTYPTCRKQNKTFASLSALNKHRRDCLDAPYICMHCNKQYQSVDSSNDHKRKKSECQNAQVGILQRRRRLLVATNYTEHLIESKEGFSPVDPVTMQLLNVNAVEEVEPNH